MGVGAVDVGRAPHAARRRRCAVELQQDQVPI